ncbi:uncharacterized protein LOC135127329 [Zophobas morio]|uniref:uncharacterized protein LOC135127329 n=1 Tax=Zophobas morio TaxID=2755281 RepID=UPI003082A759
MEDLYEQTIERSEQIKKAGYNLIEMWECKWIKSKEYKEEMKQIKSKYKEIEELNPRNAFFGGRTNATKLKVKGKKMKYIDICSLYPTVQCYDDYPVGYPTKIFKPPTYNSKWKSGDEKLTFPLCQLCAKLNNSWTTSTHEGRRPNQKDKCTHTESQSVRGTWCTNELETSEWRNDFESEEEYRKAVKENLEYVTDIKRFYEILLDDRLDNIHINELNENMLQIDYKSKGCYLENDFNTNIFIAAFTTANARLRLYEMLDILGESVAYYDTDSIVYIDNGKNTVKTGCLLGDWTDELGKVVCKIKGFTLNYETSEKINSDSMNNILEHKDSKISTQYNRITRDSKTTELLNKIETKEFGFVYDKRVILENFDTIPFGY